VSKIRFDDKMPPDMLQKRYCEPKENDSDPNSL